MQLHLLLRYLDSNIPIVLFDVQGIEISASLGKDSIDKDLYDCNILSIEMGKLQTFNQVKPALYIMLEK